MFETELATAASLLKEALAKVRENGSAATVEDVRDALLATRELSQLVTQIQVEVVAAGERNGVFTAAGYKRPDSAVANILGVERGAAREIVRAAEHLTPQLDQDGHELPVELPAMAAAFTAGRASLRQVNLIARLLDRPTARRLPAEVWGSKSRSPPWPTSTPRPSSCPTGGS